MQKWIWMFAGLALVGCSGSINQTISETFEIDATTRPEPDGCAVVTKTVDLTSIPDFQQVQDRVQKVEITSLKLTVVNPQLSPDSVATNVSGQVQVSDTSGNQIVNLGVYTPLQLTVGNSQNVTVIQGGADLFNDLTTKAPYQVNVLGVGCADQFPAHFSLQGDLTAKVTFKLL